MATDKTITAKKKKATILAMRKICSGNYLKYVEIVNDSGNKDADWIPGKHLVFLCNKIQEFVETDTGNAYDILVLNQPPQTGKSTSVTETLPSWFLGKHPDSSVIAVAYGDDLAQRFGRRNKEKIEKYGKIIFGISVSKSKSANDDFEIEGHKGRFIARGVLAGLTGNPAKLLIIDDPLRTREEAYSAVTREKIWQEWQSSMRTRLAYGAKVIIIMTRWHCMVDNTPVLCYNSVKRIDAIKVGDMVLTTNGYEEVIAMNITKPEDGKAIIEIKPYYFANPIKCTTDHRILTQRGYVEAKDIKPLQDYIVFPKTEAERLSEEQMLGLIPKLEQKEFKRKTAMTGVKNRVKKEDLETLLKQGKTYFEVAELYGYKTKQAIMEYASLYGLNSTNCNSVDENIIFDNDFWWFVGLWLAEGTVTYGRKGANNVVRLTLSHAEVDFANRVKDCFSKYGVEVGIKHQPQKSITHVHFSSQQIAKFLLSFNHGSHNKEIPGFINRLPDDNFFHFLHGYWQGDGCYSEKHGYRFTTVSRGIVEGLHSALLMRGYFASAFGKSPNKKISSIQGKPIVGGSSYELRVNEALPYPFAHISGDPPKRKFSYSDKNNFYFKVRKTTENTYGGFLYDLQTPSNNFVTTSGTVHNCDDLAGQILKTEKNVTHINLTCEAEENDILGREVGDGIFPEIGKGRAWKDEMKAAYIASDGMDAWMSMYQGQPVIQSGNIFKRDWFKFYDRKDLPTMYQTILSVDAAFKDTKTSDFVAIGVWGKSGSSVYLLDVINERMDFVRTLETIRQMKHKYPQTNMVLVEDKANGSAIISTLQREIMGVVPVNPLGSKESRAYAIQPFLMAGNVFLPRGEFWVEEYLDQMARFPKAKHDDMVDMTSQALIRLKDYTANAPAQTKPKGDFATLEPKPTAKREITGGKISKSYINFG